MTVRALPVAPTRILRRPRHGRRGLAAAVALALALAGGAACSTGAGTSIAPTSTTFAGPPPALPATTSEAVAQLVARYGSGPVPSTRYAFGTYHQALRALGLGDLPKGTGDTEVFVVTLDGAFTLAGAGTAKDSFVPKGRYLVAMFRKDAPDVPLQLGVTDVAPHLDQVGQVAVVGISS